MLIFKEWTSPSNASGTYHLVNELKLAPLQETAVALITTYTDETLSRIAWQDGYAVPMEVFEPAGDVGTLLYNWLVSTGAPFDGGVVLDSGTADLATARAKRWSRAKTHRDRAEWAGCETPLGRVDTTPASELKISGAVQLAVIAEAAGEPFSIPWTMADDSTVVHDAAAMIAMGVAVGEHVAACHAHALVLRTAIEAAETVEDVLAVDTDTGWPVLLPWVEG